MQKLPISVFIITKNEEDRISQAISSVIEWAAEVIVIDSGSNDNTVQIAKDLGAQTLFREWNGYGEQKIYGESICKNHWVLNIDADEEITHKLRDEILQAFQNDEPEYKAYKFIIKMLDRFSEKPKRFAPAHVRVRLYDKNHAGFKASSVHDSVELKKTNMPTKTFKNLVLHRSFRSYRHAIAKINRYSGMQAQDMLERGRRPSQLRIILEPINGFIKGYFFKRYFLLGVDGFIEGFIYAFARMMRLIKARELWKEHDAKQGK